MTYDIAGNVLTSTDPDANKTTFSYNDDGANEYVFPTLTTNALGQKASATYDYGIGKLLTSTDLNANTTTFSYNDYFDHFTNVQYANGQKVLYTWSQPQPVVVRGDQTAVGDQALGTQTVYDAVGRAIESDTLESACGSCYFGQMGTTQYIAAKTAYDALGRVPQTSNPSRQNPAVAYSGNVTTYTYDVLNELNE